MQDNEQIKKKYSFKLNVIGDALAQIVSQIEGKEYTYTSVETYERITIGRQELICHHIYSMAIVQEGYEQALFCTNPEESIIWRNQNIALIFKNNYTFDGQSTAVLATKDMYLNNIFKQSCFPYLDDYIKILANYREQNGEITREIAFKLAFNYVGYILLPNFV